MIKIGDYNTLEVLRLVAIGAYLNDGDKGILLPNRFMPAGLRQGDEVTVFIYHDSEDRLIATTEKPFGILGDIVKLKVVSTTSYGAFMNWGLMKDLFVPLSQQLFAMHTDEEYIVKIFKDTKTDRIAATERVEKYLSNEDLTVAEMDEVELMVLRQTDLGFLVIINNVHTGVLHNSEVFRTINIGDKFKGFIKRILPENKIDVIAGKMGYSRVEDETEKILRLLNENNGVLPYHDKSNPEEIYAFFAMSKKTFKMTIGNLYKERKISLEGNGIRLKN
jgi:uncharacterized protein